MYRGSFGREEDPTIFEVVLGIALGIFVIGSASMFLSLTIFAVLFDLLFTFLIASGVSEMIAFLAAYSVGCAGYMGAFCGMWRFAEDAIKLCVRIVHIVMSIPSFLINTVSSLIAPLFTTDAPAAA